MTRQAHEHEDERVSMLRVPPHAIDAEQQVLGAIMLDERALPKIADWLAPEDFYRRDHQIIYRAICQLADQQKPIDPVTMADWFEANGMAEQVGGMGYLIDLGDTQASSANIVAHAEIVREKSAMRTLIDVGTQLANGAFEPKGRNSRDLAADAAHSITEITGRVSARSAKPMKDVLSRWFADLQRRYEQKGLIGLATPWAKLNRILCGLCAGDLIYLAARPSMGKSALALNLAMSAGMRGKRTLIFNLEMTDISMTNRCVAALQKIPLQWLRQPDDENDHLWSRVAEGVAQLKGADITVDDQAGLTARQIVARAKREHLRKPLDLVVIDHMHIIRRAGKNPVQEIGEDSREFKALAKSLGCPVLVLSQLNRSLESRADKRPTMPDLRESGALEQDADVILFLYRDDYYAKMEGRESDHPGMVELIVAKQREGEAGGTVWLRDMLSCGLLDDYEGEEPQAFRRRTTVRGSSGFDRRAGSA